MKVLDRWRYDPVVRGLVSTGNGVAAVFIFFAWYGKEVVSIDSWPMAFVLALLPLRGDVHQRFWNFARTEWLHASGFVSRTRLAAACAVQDAFEALLRAGVIVMLAVQIRSSGPTNASLYSWLTLGCTSWIGMFAAWFGVLLLVRGSWSLAVNLDPSRVHVRHGKPTVQRNDASEDSFGPIAWLAALGWIGIAAAGFAVVRRGLALMRDPGWSAHVRGSVLLRLLLALAIAAPPCVIGLWLGRAWIPALCGVGVLVLLWQCVVEKEFATSLSTGFDSSEDSGVDSESEPAERSTAPRTQVSSTHRSARTAHHPVPRPSIARVLLWRQIDRKALLGIGALLLIVLLLRWSIGALPVTSVQAGRNGWLILVVVLLFVPGRIFRWTSTGEHAEFLVAHGCRFAWLRRAELTAGIGVVAAMVALCSLLVAGLPRAWTEWTCLLVASSQALLACNASPLTAKKRVCDATTAHGVFAGIFLAMCLGGASEASAMWAGLGFAVASFLVAASLWVIGWWRTCDEAALRTLELPYVEGA